MGVRQPFQLKGRVAHLTGGSRGMSLQMAAALGEMDCNVAISARKADELQHSRESLRADGVAVQTVMSDLQKTVRIPTLLNEVAAVLGPIDILVNNVGASYGAPAEEYPDDAWHKIMNLNVSAHFFLAREVGRHCMIPRKYAKIINVASVAGLRGMPSDDGGASAI